VIGIQKSSLSVYLDSFWIDQTEVTNVQFAAFVGATGYETTADQKGGGYTLTADGLNYTEGADWQHPRGPESDLSGLDNHPVVLVSWDDAAAFCEWRDTRLPSEAEWEKAARGDDGRTYPWGDDAISGEMVNFCDVNCDLDWKYVNTTDGYTDTSPVGNYPAGASPYGALDMAGNVWEWVADWYGEDYYSSAGANDNPVGPPFGRSRVLRGGSWYNDERNIRAADRLASPPDNRGLDFGFRCAGDSSP
jgi:formylglycine-generating enzyme required for sulfatase activity